MIKRTKFLSEQTVVPVNAIGKMEVDKESKAENRRGGNNRSNHE